MEKMSTASPTWKEGVPMEKRLKYYLYFALLLYASIPLKQLFYDLRVPEYPNIALIAVNFLAGMIILVALFKPERSRVFLSLLFAAIGAGFYMVITYWLMILYANINSLLPELGTLAFQMLFEVIFIALYAVIFYFCACFSLGEAFFPLRLGKTFSKWFIALLIATAVLLFCIKACALRLDTSGIFGRFGNRVGRYFIGTLDILRGGMPVLAIMITAMWIDFRRTANVPDKSKN